MTKTIKMSLVAAMAAGIATTASAQSLTDAIQNVDVSGYVDYRKEYKSTEGVKDADVNEYAINVTLTSKVNDMVKATVSAGFDEVQTRNTVGGETSGADKTVGGETTPTGDANPAIAVSNAYFTFDLGAVTLMAGKQNIPSAFVDQADTVKVGTGLVALAKVNDALTLAAAHFTNNNIAAAATAKTTELVAMGKAGMVSYGVHYNMTDAYAFEADRLYVTATVNAGPVKVTGEHAQVSTDAANGATTKYDDASVSNITVAGKAGPVALSGTYFTADRSGDNTATNVAIDEDNDAVAHVKVWQLSTTSITNKGNGIALSAGFPIAGNVSGKVVYATATNDADGAADYDTDVTETMAMVDYKMSKNFKIHARYSVLNTDDKDPSVKETDTDYSRIQVKYTF